MVVDCASIDCLADGRESPISQVVAGFAKIDSLLSQIVASTVDSIFHLVNQGWLCHKSNQIVLHQLSGQA